MERDYCQVCGIGRAEFSKNNSSIDFHKKSQHDPWHYVYFIYYLDKKGVSELNGLEQSCYDSFKSLMTDWIPIGDTLYLKKSKERNEVKPQDRFTLGFDKRLTSMENMMKQGVRQNDELRRDVSEILYALKQQSTPGQGPKTT